MDIFTEAEKTIYDIINEKRNFILIGEAGSGKSEIALNLAKFLTTWPFTLNGSEPVADFGDHGTKANCVDLFDLDQTKPLYRARDCIARFNSVAFVQTGETLSCVQSMASENRGSNSACENIIDGIYPRSKVQIYYQDQYLDAPTMVGGVRASLISDNYTVLDIGGGRQAARYAGAYRDLLNRDDSIAIYVVNPYRIWTQDAWSIAVTMTHIIDSTGLQQLYILANPNLGYGTTAYDVLEGIKHLNYLLEDISSFTSVCAKRDICDEVRAGTDKAIFPLDLQLTYEWADADA